MAALRLIEGFTKEYRGSQGMHNQKLVVDVTPDYTPFMYHVSFTYEENF